MNNKALMIYLSQIDKYKELSRDEWYELSWAAIEYAQSGIRKDFNDRYLRTLFNDWCKSIDSDYAKYEKKKADTAERVRRYREKESATEPFGEHPEAPKSSNGHSCKQTSFEARMGGSLTLLKGRTYEEAMQLLTVQTKIADGSITEEELREYYEE